MNRDWYEYAIGYYCETLPLEIKNMIFEMTFRKLSYYKYWKHEWMINRHICIHSRYTFYGDISSTRYMLILMKDPEPKWLKFIQVRSIDGEFTVRERRDHELALIKLY